MKFQTLVDKTRALGLEHVATGHYARKDFDETSGRWRLLKGSDASLRFKTWSAAKTEADTYLVDLTFVQAPDNAEGHYIWKVNLATKQITPESRLARTLSKS